MENLRAFQDNMKLRQEEFAENADSPDLDCSLKQCCQDMIAKGKMGNRFKGGAR